VTVHRADEFSDRAGKSRSADAGIPAQAKDSQNTLEFSVLTGVHPMIEKYPLSRVAEAYEQMHSGKVRFRVVLTMGA
jgi:alcohol dehydrogenase